jgi:hypothetical protein
MRFLYLTSLPTDIMVQGVSWKIDSYLAGQAVPTFMKPEYLYHIQNSRQLDPILSHLFPV